MPIRVGHALVLFVATLAVYFATMPSAITLEDAGLFQMVCHLGGISHPPGYPLFTTLCGALVHAPGVINGNLVSALFAALAVAFFHHVSFLLTRDRAFAYIASLAWGFSYTFWSQAIIIEVYSLSALMFMLCWWALIRFESSRDVKSWYWACLVFGLALSNHWPLMILSSFCLLAYISPAWKELLALCRSPRFVFISILCVVAGLLPYGLLMLNPSPRVAVFGGIDSFYHLMKYVERSAYVDSHEIAGIADKLQYARWMFQYGFAWQMGVSLLPVVLGGLVASFYLLPRSLAFCLVLLFVGSTYLLIGLIDFQYSELYRGVFKPYPIIAFSAVAFWLALGTRVVYDYLARLTGRTVYQMSWVIGPIVVLAVFVVNYPRLDRSGATLVDTFDRIVLDSLPADTILFTRGDNESGPIGYLHYVENVRPDIELRDWDNLIFDNRLMSPFAPSALQEKTNMEYINATDRPVVVMEPLIHPRVDFGAYVMFNPAGRNVYAFLPELHGLALLLVDIYLQDLLMDDHEKYFLNYVLMRFSEQYIGYSMAHDGELYPLVTEGVSRLQETFPGRFITLQKYINAPPEARDREKLLALAELAEADIPTYAPRGMVASFYEIVGRLVAMDPTESDRAQRYFKKSVDIYPLAANPANCLLLLSYERQGQEAEGDSLKDRFPDLTCDQTGN